MKVYTIIACKSKADEERKENVRTVVESEKEASANDNDQMEPDADQTEAAADLAKAAADKTGAAAEQKREAADQTVAATDQTVAAADVGDRAGLSKFLKKQLTAIRLISNAVKV